VACDAGGKEMIAATKKTTCNYGQRMARVSKGHPCPVCGKLDWCLVAKDGNAAICARIESTKRIGDAGYLHILKDIKSARPKPITIKTDTNVPAEMSVLAEQYQQAMTAKRYSDISTALSVSEASLRRLCAGWDGSAYSFPMFDANGQIIGIRRRFPNGRKTCVMKSRNGLFLPDGLTGISPLLIVEGNSDAAAGLDIGFDCIGRPNCSGGVELVVRYVCKQQYHSIVVIPDNDSKLDGSNPGAVGGHRLAAALRLYCSDVRIVLPPANYNDLRAWKTAGLNRVVLLEIIRKTSPVKLEIRG
jgi:hypothetical protein